MSATEKYRRAGIVAQSGLAFVLRLLHQNIGEQTIGEVCRAGDAFLAKQIDQSFKKVAERGIAQPVDISKADFVKGVSPEAGDVFQGGILNEGDVVKVSLGVHIDGYTVFAGHTVVIREGQPAEPFTGTDADAVAGTYLASEAVLSLLSIPLSSDHPVGGAVTGARIRKVVEEIAQAFDLAVVPGSRVRRIRKFVAGQVGVQEKDPKSVEWIEYSGEPISYNDEFEVLTGETWLVDISLASKSGVEGHVKLFEFNGFGNALERPTVYSRDFTVSYLLKTLNARTLLSKADKRSVYPFKLSYLSEDEAEMRKLRLGLTEIVQRRLLVPHPRLQARFVPNGKKQGTATTVAREVSTLKLIAGADSASGFPEALRLSGGQQFPPSWVQSKYELASGEAADLLNARGIKLPSIRYLEITGRVAEDNSGAMEE